MEFRWKLMWQPVTLWCYLCRFALGDLNLGLLARGRSVVADGSYFLLLYDAHPWQDLFQALINEYFQELESINRRNG